MITLKHIIAEGEATIATLCVTVCVCVCAVVVVGHLWIYTASKTCSFQVEFAVWCHLSGLVS